MQTDFNPYSQAFTVGSLSSDYDPNTSLGKFQIHMRDNWGKYLIGAGIAWGLTFVYENFYKSKRKKQNGR